LDSPPGQERAGTGFVHTVRSPTLHSVRAGPPISLILVVAPARDAAERKSRRRWSELSGRRTVRNSVA
jgi:hypothetical protein